VKPNLDLQTISKLNIKILPEDVSKRFRFYAGYVFLRLSIKPQMIGQSLFMFVFSKKMGAEEMHDLTNKRHQRRRFNK
jgi:ribosomal protein S19